MTRALFLLMVAVGISDNRLTFWWFAGIASGCSAILPLLFAEHRLYANPEFEKVDEYAVIQGLSITVTL
jgi:hypothetical protein